jgi:hypothetical protein
MTDVSNPFRRHLLVNPVAPDPFAAGYTEARASASEEASPFDTPIQRRQLDIARDELEAVTLCAIRQTLDGQIPPAELKTILEDRSIQPAGINERKYGLPYGTFPILLARMEKQKLVTIDRTPGRVRVRCYCSGMNPTRPHPFNDAWGKLATGAIDLVDAADDVQTANRARRSINDAISGLVKAQYPIGEVRYILSRMLSDEAQGIVFAMLEEGYEHASVEVVTLTEKIMRTVRATDAAGALRSHIERDLGRAASKAAVSSEIEVLLARGKLRSRRVVPNAGGRPGWRLFA